MTRTVEEWRELLDDLIANQDVNKEMSGTKLIKYPSMIVQKPSTLKGTDLDPDIDFDPDPTSIVD